MIKKLRIFDRRILCAYIGINKEAGMNHEYYVSNQEIYDIVEDWYIDCWSSKESYRQIRLPEKEFIDFAIILSI